jgi:hypothetical protein
MFLEDKSRMQSSLFEIGMTPHYKIDTTFGLPPVENGPLNTAHSQSCSRNGPRGNLLGARFYWQQ